MNIEQMVAIGSYFKEAQSLGARTRNMIQDLMQCPSADLTMSDLKILEQAKEVATRVWGTHSLDRAIIYAKEASKH